MSSWQVFKHCTALVRSVLVTGVVFCALSSSIARGQTFSIGLKGGPVLTDGLGASGGTEPRVGYTFGLLGQARINRMLRLQLETGYITRGYRSASVSFARDFEFLETLLMFQLRLVDAPLAPYATLGFGWAMRLSSERRFDGSVTPEVLPLSNGDVQLATGLGARRDWGRWFVGAEFRMGFGLIGVFSEYPSNLANPKHFTAGLHLSGGYRLSRREVTR